MFGLKVEKLCVRFACAKATQNEQRTQRMVEALRRWLRVLLDTVQFATCKWLLFVVLNFVRGSTPYTRFIRCHRTPKSVYRLSIHSGCHDRLSRNVDKSETFG